MAQGAATSIEDAAILARCLEEVQGDDIEGAFKRYEAHRKPRTSRDAGDLERQYLDEGRRCRHRWLYGYDAWGADLDRPAANPKTSKAA